MATTKLELIVVSLPQHNSTPHMANHSRSTMDSNLLLAVDTLSSKVITVAMLAMAIHSRE